MADHLETRSNLGAQGSATAAASIDWSAAFWAGLAAGTLFLLHLIVVMPRVVGGNAWVFLRYLASTTLGEGVLAPPATFDGGVLAAALLSHYAISIGFAFLIAIVLHRFGIIVGLLGGALFGLGLYAIDVYALTMFRPWLFALAGMPFAIAHVLFGAAAGSIYELLEEEEVA